MGPEVGGERSGRVGSWLFAHLGPPPPDMQRLLWMGDAPSVRLPIRSLIPRHTAQQGALEVKPTLRVVPEMTWSHDGQRDPPRARSRPCQSSAHTSLLSRVPKRFSVLSPTHALEQLPPRSLPAPPPTETTLPRGPK